MKLFVIEQMRKAVSASGAVPASAFAHAEAAGVDELAVERDAVGEAGRSEFAERLGEERIEGGCELRARVRRARDRQRLHSRRGILECGAAAPCRSVLRNAIRGRVHSRTERSSIRRRCLPCGSTT